MSDSKFSAQFAEEICDWLAQGVAEVDGKFVPCTLRAWCRQPGRPSYHAVYRWIEQDLPFTDSAGNQRTFAVAMEAARQIGADGIADDMLRICDTPIEGTRTEKDKEGTRTVTEDMLGHRRLQIHTREKLLAKWHPKKYGDRTTVAGDPDAPLGVVPVIQIAAYPDEKGGDAKD